VEREPQRIELRVGHHASIVTHDSATIVNATATSDRIAADREATRREAHLEAPQRPQRRHPAELEDRRDAHAHRAPTASAGRQHELSGGSGKACVAGEERPGASADIVDRGTSFGFMNACPNTTGIRREQEERQEGRARSADLPSDPPHRERAEPGEDRAADVQHLVRPSGAKSGWRSARAR
jgi:hypothetical protein